MIKVKKGSAKNLPPGGTALKLFYIKKRFKYKNTVLHETALTSKLMQNAQNETHKQNFLNLTFECLKESSH